MQERPTSKNITFSRAKCIYPAYKYTPLFMQCIDLKYLKTYTIDCVKIVSYFKFLLLKILFYSEAKKVIS